MTKVSRSDCVSAVEDQHTTIPGTMRVLMLFARSRRLRSEAGCNDRHQVRVRRFAQCAGLPRASRRQCCGSIMPQTVL